MATGKRYYWLKLKETFMTSDTVDYFMSQPNGANYVVLYQMLLLKTINTNGRLRRKIGDVIIPYDAEKIQRDCKFFSLDTVRVAIDLFIKFGLIERDDDGVYVMADHANLVGSETDYSEKKRRQRASNSIPLLGGDTSGDTCGDNVPIDIRDKEIDIDRRDRYKDSSSIKDLSNDIDITSINSSIPNTQLSKTTTTGSSEPQGASKLAIPLNDKTDYFVLLDDIEKWRELYPAVDIEQEIRKMIGWCDANPTKRKTRRGIKSFIVRWLAKAQDQGGSSNLTLPRKEEDPF